MARVRKDAPQLTEAKLQELFGLGKRFDLFRSLALRDYSFQPYDFQIKALDTTNLWTVAAGGTATTWAVRAEAGGWIRGVTGTTAATSGLQLSIPQKYWTGTSGALFGAIIRASSISEIRLELGFADALPSVNTPVVNSLTTPSFNTAASVAAYVYDHTGSTTTSGLYTIGSGAAAAKVATTARRPVAATPYFVAVQVLGTNVYLYCADDNGVTAVSAAGMTAADGLIPFVSVKKSDTSSANVDIDLIVTGSGRLG